MDDLSSAVQIQWKKGISNIQESAWNSLSLPLDSPFLEWEWIAQLENSKSASFEFGWIPNHLTVWLRDRLIGAALLYLKYNSSGEFVFDHIWVKLSEKIGISYYPKLIGMVPFTPVPGYRFLIASDVDETALTDLMIQAIDRFCEREKISSCSFNFVDKDWKLFMENRGFNTWQHQSFIWENTGYRDFDEYLAVFKTNQRRNIKRERKRLAHRGISVKRYTGTEISLELLKLTYDFYRRTNENYGPWACKHLTPEFFEYLYGIYRHRLLLLAAYEGNESVPVGMSMLVYKRKWLFGRYWGSRKYVPNLHFELCYYKPLEWSINCNIRYYDPGMGGYHKLRRGFRVVSNYSLHRFYDLRLSMVFNMYIDEINRMEQEQNEYLNWELPVKGNK